MYHTHTQARRAHDAALASVQFKLATCSRLENRLLMVFISMVVVAGIRNHAFSWGLTPVEFWAELTIAGVGLLAAFVVYRWEHVIVDRRLKSAGMPLKYQCTGCDDCA